MIKISVPNDDHVALRAMAKALEEIAVARGARPQNLTLENHISITQDGTWKKAHGLDEVSLKRFEQPEVDTTSQQVESLSGRFATPDELEKIDETLRNAGVDENTPVHSVLMTTPPTTDSTGTPWDERIHSASKALNADGTWRLRRKPKDMDEAEWSAYLRSVADELVSEPHGPDADNREQEALDAIRKAADDLNNGVPVAEAVAPLAQFEPSVTPEGDDFHTDAGVVTEQQVVSFPPPPPVPQVLTPVQEAKVAEVVAQATMTFPQVMAFLTERHGRITSAQVDQIIADMGLEKITDLNTQPEHTGPFIARVKALLGE